MNRSENPPPAGAPSGAAGRPLPPPELRRLVGDTDAESEFLAVAEGMSGMLRHYGLLGRGVRLLDVGCGCGRAALALLDSEIDRYFGFDRNPDLVDWAARHITPLDPRFAFRTVSVASPYDELDGHRGAIAAEEFRFPVEDASFDSALLASLFTHMPMASCRRYLAELSRALVPGGLALGSWFLVEREVEWNFELAYYLPRSAVGRACRESGLVPTFLNPGAGRNRQSEAPNAHEWLLLRKR